MARERPSETATARPVAVRCTDVTHEYGGRSSWLGSDAGRSVTALRDVSLEIRSNEVVGLTGPSGSGKSTVLHAIAGLVVPTAGTVELLGTDLTTRSETERTRLRRESVGLVFQQFHLLPALSAAANVALPLVQLGYGRRDRRTRARELLEQVGLGDRVDHRPGELSGGEQQRVAIARSLVTDPDVVLADEPTGELDTETGMAILALLVDVADERTVVLATHDERAVDRMHRVVRLLDGEVIDDGR
ncbi:ATP-binding cassette domain-containing protein [Natronorubrum sp. JWXQ-INN-674]|uniref:ATP-binding cassette domain-containing protein n=1 Tax=Natronorubrum halalkaliphilum TaxID=2691917 RepID=A0A6B0VL41_9EURY|nr:ABC transporter ATP-binding protein [Natronorubrum halalkaliphilum]MXV61827.1 ATP-binding cassette domain-containing protein [Natronorubrum halalkaliphilum]